MISTKRADKPCLLQEWIHKKFKPVWLVIAEVANFTEVREAVPVHISSKSPSLMCATLLPYLTEAGLFSPFTVPGHLWESPMDLSRVPITANTSRSSVGQGIGCFIISICLYMKQQQSSPLSHFPERCIDRED